MCSYWVHVVQSVRIVAGTLIALACFGSFMTVPFYGYKDISFETATRIWMAAAFVVVTFTAILVFAPTAEIVAEWCVGGEHGE